MNLLVINPNDSEPMRRLIETSCRDIVGCRTHLQVVCAGAGVASVEGFYDGARTLPALLTRIEQGEQNGIDGYLIACADDTGLHAARELARGPVIGIGEASLHTATLLGCRFSVLTAQRKSVPILEQNIRAYGFEHLARGVSAAEMPVLDLSDAGEDSTIIRHLAEHARNLLTRHDSEVLVLGCAGMSRYRHALEAALGLPVVDGVTSGLLILEGLVRAGLKTSKVNGYGRI